MDQHTLQPLVWKIKLVSQDPHRTNCSHHGIKSALWYKSSAGSQTFRNNRRRPILITTHMLQLPTSRSEVGNWSMCVGQGAATCGGAKRCCGYLKHDCKCRAACKAVGGEKLRLTNRNQWNLHRQQGHEPPRACCVPGSPAPKHALCGCHLSLRSPSRLSAQTLLRCARLYVTMTSAGSALLWASPVGNRGLSRGDVRHKWGREFDTPDLHHTTFCCHAATTKQEVVFIPPVWCSDFSCAFDKYC